jgi:CDP-paratose 2-epimerase
VFKALFFEFFRNPRPGEVYNLGGDRENTLSILETIGTLGEIKTEPATTSVTHEHLAGRELWERND